METLVTFSDAKVAQQFYCKKCDYYTNKKSSFEKHNETKKHKVTFSDAKVAYVCDICEKIYSSRNGLWVHKKNCNKVKEPQCKNNETLNNINFDTNIILELVKKNQDFQKEMFLDMQKQMFDFMKDNIGDNNTMYNVNSNNKTFNLQVFLNETCKDAMNITDFVNSIQLQLSDLENVGKVGYIEGISNIIIKNLKALDVEKRPVHCTDQKREVIYVKEDNIWEKEDETNKQLRKAIKLVAHKNICMLKSFRDKYPDFDDGDSRRSNQYNKIVIEAMGGKGDNEYEKDTKIIKKITKVVGIDKN
jgi:hypothetical protein